MRILSVIELDWTGADFGIVRFTLPAFLYLSVILMRQLACHSGPCLTLPSEWRLRLGQPPSTLKSGNYLRLIRHEIITLHLATQKGGAESYPFCTQLRVDGNQTGGPADNELVSLPGADNDNYPGIFDPQVRANLSCSFLVPGH